jgi:hypothetical protein
MQGASNISFGLSYLIMRERLTPAVFGVAAFATSLILKPRTADSGLSH